MPARLRDCVPPSHTALQALQPDQLPQQAAVLQDWDSEVLPQPAPVRVRVWLPPPHAAVHALHDDHDPHVGGLGAGGLGEALFWPKLGLVAARTPSEQEQLLWLSSTHTRTLCPWLLHILEHEKNLSPDVVKGPTVTPGDW
eukprot:gnl/TRDRNA2_/TRDRNA2_152556_c0_seq2.p3 gnl/TRDRNA2_/TRDRNA2_152556_c0~~gnl/TRDRNA2_/TRDRNA2_152556_c0_seq2.p3  ORF type:complete len:141 (+),score=12.42 gnl/TRDRNA2_/TRDRNA2_152556_c0_seq2:734-1156(+)